MLLPSTDTVNLTLGLGFSVHVLETADQNTSASGIIFAARRSLQAKLRSDVYGPTLRATQSQSNVRKTRFD
jgi:hypothetical protein